MIYEVTEKQGRTLRVGLTEVSEGKYEMVIGDETYQVDAVTSGRTIYSIIENGKQFEGMVDEKGIHDFDVLVGGRLFHLEAVDERTKLLAASAQVVAEGTQAVKAEMPGKVVKVCVEVGDQVASGDGIVIVEAMKMENEIRSPIDGVVSEIAVSAEETVEPGDTLFVVDPPEQAPQ